MAMDHSTTGVRLPEWLMDKLKDMVGRAAAQYDLTSEQKAKLLFLLCSCEAKAITGRCYRECKQCTRCNTLYMEQYGIHNKTEHDAIMYLIKEEARLADD